MGYGYQQQTPMYGQMGASGFGRPQQGMGMPNYRVAQPPAQMPPTAPATTPEPTAPTPPTPPAAPALQGGMAGFNDAADLTKRQMKGREAFNFNPLTFQAPTNVTLRQGFTQDLDALKNQYLPALEANKRGRVNRQSQAAYNQALAGLDNNAAYQNAVKSLFEKEGLSKLLSS